MKSLAYDIKQTPIRKDEAQTSHTGVIRRKIAKVHKQMLSCDNSMIWIDE